MGLYGKEITGNGALLEPFLATLAQGGGLVWIRSRGPTTRAFQIPNLGMFSWALNARSEGTIRYGVLVQIALRTGTAQEHATQKTLPEPHFQRSGTMCRVATQHTSDEPHPFSGRRGVVEFPVQ